MIGGLIIVYLYVLIGCWLIFLAWKHAEAISLFSFKRWIFGQSHSAVLFKGLLAICVLMAGFMLVGYMESLESRL